MELCGEVNRYLRGLSIPSQTIPVDETALPQIPKDTDLAITLGGDGTLLYGASRAIIPYDLRKGIPSP